MVLTFKRISFSFASAWHFKLQRYVWRLSLDLQKPSIMITFGSIKQKPCYVIWRKLFSHPFLFNSYIQQFLRTLLARLNTDPTEGQKICKAQKNRKHMEGKDVASGTVDIGRGSNCPPITTLVPTALLRTNIAGPRLLEFTSVRLKMVDWTFDCHY